MTPISEFNPSKMDGLEDASRFGKLPYFSRETFFAVRFRLRPLQLLCQPEGGESENQWLEPNKSPRFCKGKWCFNQTSHGFWVPKSQNFHRGCIMTSRNFIGLRSRTTYDTKLGVVEQTDQGRVWWSNEAKHIWGFINYYFLWNMDYLVVSTPLKKYARVKLDRFPKYIGEHEQTYLSCHHPAEYVYRSKTPTRTILTSLGVSHLRSLTVSPLNKWWQRGDGNLSFCDLAIFGFWGCL